jgi:hypothetical protein
MDTRYGIAADLADLADELESLETATTAAYARRLDLFLAARALDPPMTQRELAGWSRITKGAVTQVLRKVRLNHRAAA